MDNKKVCDKY